MHKIEYPHICGLHMGVLQMQWFTSLAAWQQALLASLITYTATTLGASLVFFSKKLNQSAITALTGGAAGIMIAASFFSLLMPALDYEAALPAFLTVTLGFLLGGTFIVGSDLLLTRKKPTFKGLGRKNVLLYLAITLHNIPEGMAVGVAFAAAGGVHGAVVSALLFAVGIAVQNFPEGACVAFPLRTEGMPPSKAFLFSQASGLVEIPACVLGAMAATTVTGLMSWALAFCAGAMVAVVCAELIPECYAGNKTCASIGIIAGFCLMMILDLALS